MSEFANPVISGDIRRITAVAGIPWSALEGKRVLVTGAGGFIPSYIIKTLLFLNETRFSRKIEILALAHDARRARKRFAADAGGGDMVFLRQTLSSPLKIKGPVDVIIHGASYASPAYYGSDPVGTLEPNVIGTCELLKLAREKKTQAFLFISSAEIYGKTAVGTKRLSETVSGELDPLELRSCYAESKRMGETMCVSWRAQYGVPVKIMRLFHTYGPAMKLNDGRVHSDFFGNVAAGRDIVMNSDGLAVRCFCYISDAVAGAFAVLLKGAPGEAYNIGNPEGCVSIAQFARLLVKLAPAGKLKVVMNANGGKTGYIKSGIACQIPDISKAEKLGWKPVVSLEEGCKRTMAALRSR
ncbi:MAG: NAD-dependent epimerase/dehydratase family protein [Elusimicrobiales bacterium]|nr:NAD-dependent epimerase/dehydratase family protein [Elusimicrobiales bacterium]